MTERTEGEKNDLRETLRVKGEELRVAEGRVEEAQRQVEELLSVRLPKEVELLRQEAAAGRATRINLQRQLDERREGHEKEMREAREQMKLQGDELEAVAAALEEARGSGRAEAEGGGGPDAVGGGAPH